MQCFWAKAAHTITSSVFSQRKREVRVRNAAAAVGAFLEARGQQEVKSTICAQLLEKARLLQLAVLTRRRKEKKASKLQIASFIFQFLEKGQPQHVCRLKTKFSSTRAQKMGEVLVTFRLLRSLRMFLKSFLDKETANTQPH